MCLSLIADTCCVIPVICNGNEAFWFLVVFRGKLYALEIYEQQWCQTEVEVMNVWIKVEGH